MAITRVKDAQTIEASEAQRGREIKVMESKTTRERDKRWRNSRKVRRYRQKRKRGHARFSVIVRALWRCREANFEGRQNGARDDGCITSPQARMPAHTNTDARARRAYLDNELKNPTVTQRGIHENKRTYKTEWKMKHTQRERGEGTYINQHDYRFVRVDADTRVC